MNNIFFEIGIILIFSTILAYGAYLLRQPMLLSYLVAGILIGPSGFGVIINTEVIQTLSEIGILFFLFIIGLEINVQKLQQYGKPALIAGIAQLVTTFLVGFLALISFFSVQETIYLSLALVFSSTIVVVKLLSEKAELDTIHGRIILGILILQDIFAIIAVGMLQTTSLPGAIFAIIVLFFITILLATVVVPFLFSIAARSQELLFISAVMWCFLGALGGNLLGFSTAIGGFLAGLSLANSDVRMLIVGKMQPLRDFFSILFFVTLGMQLTFTLTTTNIISAFILLLWVVVGQSFVVATTLMWMRFHKKVAFLTAISVAQTSEFSLIFAAQAFAAGKISDNTTALIAFVTATSIILSSYMIKYDVVLYQKTKWLFKWIKGDDHAPTVLERNNMYEAILLGHDRIGFKVLQKLRELGKKVLVVEINPDIVKKLHKESVPCAYGDLGDEELFSHINWQTVHYVISTIPSKEDSTLLIQKIKRENNTIIMFARAHTIEDALALYDVGADYVIIPHLLGGDHVAEMMQNMSIAKITEYRIKHLRDLHDRRT